MSDYFGDRMKMYEKIGVQKFIPMLPVCVRLDGKGFSKFTKNLKRPYDIRLTDLMQDTTKYLIEETNACMGYTQSDEITLVFYSSDYATQIFFGGKIQKMISVLASMTTGFFNHNLGKYIKEKKDTFVTFDCRAWQVPNLSEGANVFLWREYDATKNSVSMACREYYSHKQMMNLGRADQMELLHKAGINWNDYPVSFKRGAYFQRKLVPTTFSFVEIENLPPQHQARTNPDIEIMRHQVLALDMPIFSKVTNREDVVFHGKEPETYDAS